MIAYLRIQSIPGDSSKAERYPTLCMSPICGELKEGRTCSEYRACRDCDLYRFEILACETKSRRDIVASLLIASRFGVKHSIA
jgi:hypothetical protein